MDRRLFLFFCVLTAVLFSVFPKTACLNSSIADLWVLSGGTVDLTVGESVERGITESGVLLLDNGSGRNINREMLVDVEPDLVLGSADTASHVRLKAFLDEIHIPMILIEEDSFDDFLEIYGTLTSITGREDLYSIYGIGQKEEIGKIILEAEKEEEKPSVLFVRAGSAFSSVRAKRAENHFAARIIEDLGARNIADEAEALSESLSLEAILELDPDMILIVAQGDEKESMDYMDALFSRPGWRDIRAVKEENVHFLSRDLFHFKPNGRWAESYREMKDILYGN